MIGYILAEASAVGAVSYSTLTRPAIDQYRKHDEGVARAIRALDRPTPEVIDLLSGSGMSSEDFAAACASGWTPETGIAPHSWRVANLFAKPLAVELDNLCGRLRWGWAWPLAKRFRWISRAYYRVVDFIQDRIEE